MSIEEDKIFFDREIVVFYTYLLRFITTISNDKLIAYDIVQETMETAWEKLDTIRSYNDIKLSLVTIAKNKFINHHRKNKQKYKTLLIDNIQQKEEDDFFKHIIEKEEQRVLLLTVSKLREDYIRIILMHYYYDITLKEVAELINVNYNTVVSWHKRALEHLQRLLEKYNVNEK